MLVVQGHPASKAGSAQLKEPVTEVGAPHGKAAGFTGCGRRASGWKLQEDRIK